MPLSAGGRTPLALLAWRAAATVAAPALRLMLRRRAARGREVAARLGERRGVEPAPRPPGLLLWVHAASVGETASVLPVLAALPEAVSVLLTTATVTGGVLAERRLAEMGLSGRMAHRFAPLDVPAWGARFLDHWRPDAAAFVESELWPSLLAQCRARGIPAALVNARLSDRSARGWARAPSLARHVLGGFALIAAQSDEDAARLRALGARDVAVPGNLKYAAPPLPVDEAALARLRGALGGRPAWLAASTHPGEEAVVLAVHRSLAGAHPGLVTIIAPRHPDRGPEVARSLAGTDGAGPTVARHGAGEGPPPGGVWVFDALGELGTLFALAGIVAMGNSLAGEGGGHNPLEPARAGCAVATGPRFANFAAVVAGLRDAGGLHVADGAEALAAWVDAMLRDPDARRAAGEAGRQAADAFAGLPGETAAALVRLLPGMEPSGKQGWALPRSARGGSPPLDPAHLREGGPGDLPLAGSPLETWGQSPWPSFNPRSVRLGPPGFWQRNGPLPRLLAPVAALVAAGTARRVARVGWRAPVAVICCGNAGVGGAGKTTVTLDLLRRLASRGVAVHALTRGHGGRARGVLRAGPGMDAALAGDEALLLAACAPTWVSADRAAGGRAAVGAGAQCLVMDDGLQNPGLVQDCALLVIDGAVGFGNGRVLPAGPLREPVAAAAARCRAAVLVGEDAAGALAALPPRLAVLRARLVPHGGERLAGRRVFGFAGIARPSKFYATLAATGAVLAGTRDFPDHHRFGAGELADVLAEAARLGAIAVTTPKDAVRLPAAVRAAVEVLDVALVWEDEAALEALLDAVVVGRDSREKQGRKAFFF